MLSFNPFGKALRELEVSDVAALRKVSEGWYVEYKETVPNASVIAKSISSFANHYGGWIFYGIAQSRDGENRAEFFPGVTLDDVPSLQQRIRDAVRIHIAPPPFFDLSVLKGPCRELNLPAGKAIVVLRVPAGSDLPYIHSSGRVYRRISDSSDPVVEKDRSTLDFLWQLGDKRRTSLSDFLMQEPHLSRAEQDNVYLLVFMIADPYGDIGTTSTLSFSQFAEVVRQSEGPYSTVPLNNVFTTNDGFMARQISTSQSAYMQGPSLRHHWDGSSMAVLPLRFGRLGDPDISDLLLGYRFGEIFVGLCRAKGLDSARLIDLNICFAALAGLIQHQQALLLKGDLQPKFFVKCRIINCWRCVPFVDTSAYHEFVAENGIPFISDDSVFAPPLTTLSTMLRVGWPEFDAYGEPVAEAEEERNAHVRIPQIFYDALPVYLQLMQAVGVEQAIVTGAERGVVEFVEATNRAIRVYGNRANN